MPFSLRSPVTGAYHTVSQSTANTSAGKRGLYPLNRIPQALSIGCRQRFSGSVYLPSLSPRNSAAGHGLISNYTTRQCHSHVILCYLGVNIMSMCLYVLDRYSFFGSACKGAPARRIPRSCRPKRPSRAGPASAPSANRRAASEVEVVAGPHRAVGPAGSEHAVPYRHSM